MPSDIRVYKVQPIPSQKSVMLQLFRALPITLTPKNKAALDRIARTPEPLLRDGLPKCAPLEETIGDWEVRVWPNGQFSASHSSRFGSTIDKPAPSDAQVRKVSDAFLSRIKPLLFSNVHFSSVGPSYMVEEIILARSSSYIAELNGLPVGRVYVEVVAGGKVVAIGSNLQRAVADRTVPILSPKEALLKLRSHEAHLADGQIANATGYVDSIKLVYWQGGTEEGQRLSYIMPVYVLKGEDVSADKQAHPWMARGSWVAYVEAVRPEFLETKPGSK
ncbi:MAG: hypothetical protein Q7N50_04545 [Armatimonadota bacterium]|nr:hypothetical protein [Armatimonadota bacterium]